MTTMQCFPKRTGEVNSQMNIETIVAVNKEECSFSLEIDVMKNVK